MARLQASGRLRDGCMWILVGVGWMHAYVGGCLGDGWINRWINKWIDGCREGWVWVFDFIYMGEWVDEWIDWVGVSVDGIIKQLIKCLIIFLFLFTLSFSFSLSLSLYIYISLSLRGKSIRSLYGGSSDWSFMVDLLSYFSFHPVLHDWCNKGCGMCYPVCGMMPMKKPLLLIRKNSLCGGSRFPLTIWMVLYHMSDAI